VRTTRPHAGRECSPPPGATISPPERSDLDFLVEFQPLPAGTYANTYFGLIEALGHLFERRVDLVEAGSVRNLMPSGVQFLG